MSSAHAKHGNLQRAIHGLEDELQELHGHEAAEPADNDLNNSGVPKTVCQWGRVLVMLHLPWWRVAPRLGLGWAMQLADRPQHHMHTVHDSSMAVLHVQPKNETAMNMTQTQPCTNNTCSQEPLAEDHGPNTDAAGLGPSSPSHSESSISTFNLPDLHIKSDMILAARFAFKCNTWDNAWKKQRAGHMCTINEGSQRFSRPCAATRTPSRKIQTQA